ncbi:hypothetical protein RF11_02411 [Thelohanellus kitauei]|uniref:Uncharacterized protein n=1 Tax=Thelohanellus kitauei TaxID=669202 RepID=A0A0C2J1G7_THEKT|nr:hypothetical protein RF11_02411 [Thelohanellus kitauei]
MALFSICTRRRRFHPRREMFNDIHGIIGTLQTLVVWSCEHWYTFGKYANCGRDVMAEIDQFKLGKNTTRGTLQVVYGPLSVLMQHVKGHCFISKFSTERRIA